MSEIFHRDYWGPYPRTISELHAYIREHPERMHVVLPSYEERRKIIDTYNYYQRQPGQPMLPEDYLDPPTTPEPLPAVERRRIIATLMSDDEFREALREVLAR